MDGLFPSPSIPPRGVHFQCLRPWGCGAWCQDEWWQCEWPQGLSQGITFKDMFAVIVAAAVWGREWRGQHILSRCDNEAVTHVIKPDQ